jgi:WD40 repeat protein
MSTRVTLSLVLGVALGVLAVGAGLSQQQTPAPSEARPKTDPKPEAEQRDHPQPQGDEQPRTDRYGDPLPPGAVARLGTTRLRFGQGEWSASVVLAPDGKTLMACSGADPVLRFWDVATGKALRALAIEARHTGGALALSPDGKVAAVGGYAGIQVWDIPAGKELLRLKLTGVGALAFTPDGKQLIAGVGSGDFRDRSVRVFDLTTAQERLRLQWHKQAVNVIGCTPDGRMLVTASRGNGTVCCADLTTGAVLRTIPNEDRSTWDRAIALGPGARLAVGWCARPGGDGSERYFRLYDLGTGKEVRRFGRWFGGHNGDQMAAAFSPNEKMLASVDCDGTLRLWDLDTGRELRKILQPAGHPSMRPVFSPDGKTLVLSDGYRIRLYDLSSGQELHPHEGHESDVDTVAFAPDGKTLATSSYLDRTVRLWDVTSAEQRHVLRHPDYVRSAMFFPDGRTVISDGGGSLIRFWDVTTGRETRSLQVEGKQDFLRTDLSADGRLLLAFTYSPGELGSAPLRTTAWELPTGKRLFQWEDPRDADRIADTAAASPDGKVVAAGEWFAVRLREAATGKNLLSLRAPETFTLWGAPVFSSDGRRLAVLSYRQREDGTRSYRDDHGVRVYDVRTGKQLHHFLSPSWLTAATFSPDGRMLAAGGNGGIRLIELASGATRLRLKTPEGHVRSLAFSPDGRRLASGMSNTTVLIWDVSPPLPGGR